MPDIKHFDPGRAIGTVVELLWERDWPNTGIADVVAATGLSRSSLYSTFGGKDALFLAALHRYLDEQVDPMFDRLSTGEAGLGDIGYFFDRLITTRCRGPRARWGCLATNLQTTAGGLSPDVTTVLSEHQQKLLHALTSALDTAHTLGQLRGELAIPAAAEHLALLAQGINLRSRAGADPRALRRAAESALASLRAPGCDIDVWPHHE